MKNKSVTFMVQAALIAAVYVVLTHIFSPISIGPLQARISEALTVLPYFTPAAIPGLFIGCIIGNTTIGCALPDIIFGSIATLIGAVGSRAVRKYKFAVPVPPILANALIVPFILRYAYGDPMPIPLMMVTVGAGEIISIGVVGMILLFALERYGSAIFKTEG